MSKGTINAKLALDNRGFVDKMRESTKSVKELREEKARAKRAAESLSRAGNLAKGAFSTLIGSIVAVKGGLDAFNKAVNSTQATGDAWNTYVAGMKGAVDSFFTTIATGDWSNLWRGIDVSIDKAEELAEAMDKVANTKMARNYVGTKRESLIAKAKEVASDPNATEEQKKKAYEDAMKYIDVTDRVNREHVLSSRKAGLATINSATANLSYTAALSDLPYTGMLGKIKKELKDIPIKREISNKEFDWLVTDGMTGIDPELVQYTKTFEMLRARAKEVETVSSISTGMPISVSTKDANKALRELAELIKKNKDLERKRQQVNLASDEKVEQAIGLVQDALRTEIEISNDRVKLNKTGKRIDLSGDGGGDVIKPTTLPKYRPKATPLAPKGSIQALEDEIAKAEKQFRQATTDSARRGLREHIKQLKQELEQVRIRINYEVGSIDTAEVSGQVVEAMSRNYQTNLRDLITNGLYSASEEAINKIDVELRNKRFDLQMELNPESRKQIEAEIESLERKRERQVRIQGVKLGTPIATIGGLPKEGVSLPDTTKHLNSYSDKLTEVADKHRQMTDTLYNVGGAFDALGTIVGGSSGEMLKWAGNTAQALAQALPNILALTGAQKGLAISGAAAHGAIGGPIGVVTSIATVLAAFASIPKFAQGGIVGGSSYYGDKILARVNSGEMIATTLQQERIYKAMEAGRANVIAQHVSVGGEFRIKGGDLVVALERAQRYNGR